MPPLLGWVAATGEYGLLPGLLFAVQFVWQFPHFWAIAWVAHDDYSRAGYQLLPLNAGRTRGSAIFILVSTVLLLPVSLLSVYFGLGGPVTYAVTICLDRKSTRLNSSHHCSHRMPSLDRQ